MELVRVEQTNIRGFSVRTCNRDETDPESAKIGGLWADFSKNISVDSNNGGTVFGVYFDYESDAAGEFSVLAGSDQIKPAPNLSLETVTINEGNYLVFRGEGAMPDVVIQLWQQIWNYFADEDKDYNRSYATDFELYRSETETETETETEIEVYIGVQS